MKKLCVFCIILMTVLMFISCRSSEFVPTTNWQGGDVALGTNPSESRPSTKPTVPTSNPTDPTAEPTTPTSEPTAPTTEPTKPTEPTQPTIPTPVLSTEAESNIKSYYIVQNGDSPEFDEATLRLEYYGEYCGAYVYFVDCNLWEYPGIEMTDDVAGLEFYYTSGQKLEVFKDGQVLKLADAYEAGWLTAESVAALHAYYKQANFYLYE